MLIQRRSAFTALVLVISSLLFAVASAGCSCDNPDGSTMCEDI